MLDRRLVALLICGELACSPSPTSAVDALDAFDPKLDADVPAPLVHVTYTEKSAGHFVIARRVLVHDRQGHLISDHLTDLGPLALDVPEGGSITTAEDYVYMGRQITFQTYADLHEGDAIVRVWPQPPERTVNVHVTPVAVAGAAYYWAGVGPTLHNFIAPDPFDLDVPATNVGIGIEEPRDLTNQALGYLVGTTAVSDGAQVTWPDTTLHQKQPLTVSVEGFGFPVQIGLSPFSPQHRLDSLLENAPAVASGPTVVTLPGAVYAAAPTYDSLLSVGLFDGTQPSSYFVAKAIASTLSTVTILATDFLHCPDSVTYDAASLRVVGIVPPGDYLAATVATRDGQGGTVSWTVTAPTTRVEFPRIAVPADLQPLPLRADNTTIVVHASSSTYHDILGTLERDGPQQWCVTQH
ncbi:MAG: hypothetical protein NT062_08835 [Proteobacteria bacterium]|nr:hypothetical protein [Pseudomonadota bacterium]